MEKNRTVTEAQISAWKKKHGSIHEIKVEQDGKTLSCIVRKPTLVDIQAAEEYGKDDTVKQNMFLYNQCRLGGDPAFNDDDELQFSASNEVAKLFRILKASSKKL